MTLKIYNQYAKYGVANYYKQYAKEYYNPHADKISEIYSKYLSEYITNELDNGKTILDIACGDGLITKIILIAYCKFQNNNTKFINKVKKQIKGCDPYFVNKYVDYTYSFEDISIGLVSDEIKYSNAICCYAFHLLDSRWYYNFFNELAEIVEESFIIITPSKKIVINHPYWVIEKEIRDNKITLIILKNIKKY